MVAPAVVGASSPVDISSSSNQQGKPLVIRQPTQHYPHRPILGAPLAFLPTPCHLEIPPPFKGAGGRPVCDSAACSATNSGVTPPTTPALTTATTAISTTTTTNTTNIVTNTKDNKMKFSSSTSNSSSASSSYTHGDSHFPNAHPEPIPYFPNHHHHHHHHHEEEEEEEEEREQEHQCELAHQEEEYIVPWQEEMRRVEAARHRRDLIEAKRIRQATQRKLQLQQQQKQQQPRQWVWVVDEEIEAVQEADVIVARNKGFSWGGRVKDVWRKVFSGKRRLSEHELPLKRQEALRKLTVDFCKCSSFRVCVYGIILIFCLGRN